MTKKHFVEMASAFRNTLEAVAGSPEGRAGVILAIEAFMSVAISVNPRFNRGTFRRACGLEG